MKSTGIIRRIDDLGRIVIPKSIRRTHDIEEGTPLELFVNGENIVFRKYQPEAWSNDELHDALIAAAKDAGKDPVDYLNRVKEGQANGK